MDVGSLTVLTPHCCHGSREAEGHCFRGGEVQSEVPSLGIPGPAGRPGPSLSQALKYTGAAGCPRGENRVGAHRLDLAWGRQGLGGRGESFSWSRGEWLWFGSGLTWSWLGLCCVWELTEACCRNL